MKDFPSGSNSKASAYNAGDPGSIPYKMTRGHQFRSIRNDVKYSPCQPKMETAQNKLSFH